MNFEDLWIGDLVFVKSLGKNASWEGKIDGNKALIKYKGETKEVSLQEIEPPRTISETDKKLRDFELQLKAENETTTKKLQDYSDKKIDLHIEKLNPSMINEAPQLILNHQLMRTRVFVDEAIERRRLMLTIIHGKGAGALKAEVKMILDKIPEIDKIHEINDGGALEIWLKY